MSSRPLVSINRVSKSYPNGTEALRDVSLQIPNRPQFLSLLGPSGCGKSTLLRMVSGLETCSRGTIDWPTTTYSAGGRPLAELGYVFQEPTLMPWANVFDNVYLPLKLKGQRKPDVKDDVMSALSMVGLHRVASSYPRELSGGMKMRVSIARALVTKPKVLLLDEPFAALDEITRQKLNNDLLALWERQRLTVIFVTHSVFESVYLSDRIVVMAARPGRVSADMPIEVPYPRDDAYRTSVTYNQYCRDVSAQLKVAMTGLEDEL
ncbi:MAG: ABC transporter ATP-binding protein [Hyphomicrobium sp.]|jgi:NitT/TauT family transport system ATP-binding protein